MNVHTTWDLASKNTRATHQECTEPHAKNVRNMRNEIMISNKTNYRGNGRNRECDQHGKYAVSPKAQGSYTRISLCAQHPNCSCYFFQDIFRGITEAAIYSAPQFSYLAAPLGQRASFSGLTAVDIHRLIGAMWTPAGCSSQVNGKMDVFPE